MNFEEIKTSDPISEAPLVINGNFELASERFDAIQEVLDHDQKTLRLTVRTTPVAGAAEMAALTLTGATGVLLSVIDSQGVPKATLSALGDATLRRVVATGTGAQATSLADLAVSGDSTLAGKLGVAKALDLLASGSKLLTKLTTLTVLDANCGSAATSKVNPAGSSRLLLDYANGGNALAGQGQLFLDTTTLEEGETFTLHCSRTNSAGGTQGLFNGIAGSEIFAYIAPTGAGMTTLPATSRPEFAPAASPNSRSYLRVRWTDIGGGTLRLLILEALNVNNIG